MVEYKCEKCGHTAKQKGHLSRHKNKKNPCVSNDKMKEYESTPDKDIRLTVADFFCGAGGFSEGFYQAGFEVVFSLDCWEQAIKTHDLNHPNCNAIVKDILELDTPEKIDAVVPDTDVIVGSPPCVSFSNSNKSGGADKTLGVKLIEQYLKIVAWKMKKGVCKYWIMENVPNSIKHVKDRYTWEELELPGEGPDLEVPVKQTLIASNYSAPQDRSRAVCGNYPIPEINLNRVTIQDVFDMLGSPLSDKKEKYTDILYNKEYKADDITDHFYDTEIRESDWMKSKRLKTDHGYMGKMSFPDTTNRPSRTVMATMSTSTREAIIFSKEGTDKYRSPTIRELSCFMGYPLDYQFDGTSDGTKHKQIGNAVCPPIAKALGIAILKKEKIIIKEPMPRIITKANLNLNGRQLVIKPIKNKSISAKYHVHVPNLKISQYRVELDNLSSDIFKYDRTESMVKIKECGIEIEAKPKKEKLMTELVNVLDIPFTWNTNIHRGAGKGAKKCYVSYETLSQYLDINLDELKKELDNITVTNSYELQKAHYGVNKEHITPDKILEHVKGIVCKYADDSLIKDIPECKDIESDKGIPKKIIVSQWCLDYLIKQFQVSL
jgi:DNA (cytosine-5)-methyltransferase 1